MVALRASFLVLLTTLISSTVDASTAPNVQLLGAQGINLWKLGKLSGTSSQGRVYAGESHQIPLADAEDEAHPHFRAHWFEQPVDHFSEDSETFKQRYWINTRHYKGDANAPVIVIDGGETSGRDRLPFLDTGIAEILANATGGIGVVLEHRYYGKSVVVQNLTTDSLRFLNNAQSAADSANFMAHVKFSGVEENITAYNTPWIYYGGSYAGARAAHMKVLYPELVFGAIASSAVTHASIENWEYMEVIRRAADPECSARLERSVHTIDSILAHKGPVGNLLKKKLKALFGVEGLEHDDDFVALIESPLGSWQAKNWDPAVGSTRWDEFCEALAQPIWKHPDLISAMNHTVEYDPASHRLFYDDGLVVELAVVNYAKYIRKNYVSRCPVDEGVTIEQCFGTYDDSAYQGTSLDDTWRLWLFQVCTEWGYFSTSPPPGLRRIVSKLLTLPYESKICGQAFPPGKHFAVPSLPNVTVVNSLGDFDIADDKLAFIDGDVDPWKPCTPHSDYAKKRPDTIQRPFKLIPGGVHHYDENGLKRKEDEPPHIQKIHSEIVEFVVEWLKDWKSQQN